MKFYLAYKFLGQDKNELRSFLEEISTVIHNLGHDSFCHFRDIQKWRGTDKEDNPSQIIFEAFKEVEKSDAVLAFVEINEKSEGMLLEIGYAKALNKKIILAIKKSLDKDFLRFVRGIADLVIEYESLTDLKKQLECFLNEGEFRN